MNRFVGRGAAAKALGVSVSTLRRWEAAGRIVPDHTSGGHRRYDLAKFRPELFHAAEAPHRTIAYACVSSNDQKADLERQKQVLELFCATNGWQFEVISNLGSGMNYRKEGTESACLTKSWIAKSVGWSSPTRIACSGSGLKWCPRFAAWCGTAIFRDP